jgi:transketolase
LFDAQSEEYREMILPSDESNIYISIEAGCFQGWHKYVGSNGMVISIDTFGASAPHKDLQKKFGFTPEAIAKKILEG